MIKGKTLKKKGWPQGPIIGKALRLAQTLAADGLSDKAILAALERVRADPDAYTQSDPAYDLAQAVIGQRAPKPIPVRDVPLDAPIWGKEIIDPQAIHQLHNAMRLPVTVGGALMPDAHVGYGIPIGGVVALENAVAPYMVGVDIACFPGDTKVPTLAGEDRTLQELANSGNRFGIWACTPSGKVVAAWATAMETRKNAALLEVTLDNGERVQCTPDHEFMLRDGSFVRADALQPDTSLMPFYSQLDPEGYLRIKQNYSGRWQRAHWIVARSGLIGEIPRFEKQRTVIHHKDFNESNNHP